MIKTLFLINNLDAGGAERVLVNLVNKMDKTKFDITVMTMYSGGTNEKLLSPDIKYVCKNAPHPKGLAVWFRFISSKRLYKYFIGDEHYDIVVAYMHGGPTKVVSGCTNKKTKLVTWLHNGNPETGSFFKFWFSKKSAIKAYKKMDAVIGVSNTVSEAFSSYTGIKTQTIYNTNDFDRILKLTEEPLDVSIDDKRIKLCSVGRVCPEKGFDRLISASAKLISEGYNIDTYIVGDGLDNEALKAQVDELGIADCVKLLGFRSNPYNVISNSDIYVLSSRTEGMPTVVSEALLLGKPIVATDVSGVRELLGESEYGLIVCNDEEALYDGLKKMLDDKELAIKYSKTAANRAKVFSPEKCTKDVETLFENLLEIS